MMEVWAETSYYVDQHGELPERIVVHDLDGDGREQRRETTQAAQEGAARAGGDGRMTDNRTTELREKLTERGVEYTVNDGKHVKETTAATAALRTRGDAE